MRYEPGDPIPDDDDEKAHWAWRFIGRPIAVTATLSGVVPIPIEAVATVVDDLVERRLLFLLPSPTCCN